MLQKSSRLLPWRVAGFLPLLILLTTGCADASQRIVEGPSDTTVRLHETVLLKCRVEEQKGAVQWVHNGFGLGTDRNLPQSDRKMVGSPSQGEYHLEITNVTVKHDGVYQCQISAEDKAEEQLSNLARLTVLVQPTRPELLGLSSQMTAVENVQVEVRCRSRGGRPHARITWAVATDPAGEQIVHEIRNGTDYHANALETDRGEYVGQITDALTVENGLDTVVSTLLFVPTKEDDGRYLVCLTSHATLGRRNEAASVKLDVNYKPRANIQLDGEKSMMKAGGRAVLKCFATAKPMASLKIIWRGKDDRVKPFDSQTAVIENLSKDDFGSEVACIARNEHGETRATYQLSFPYPPHFMSTTQNRIVQRAESARFHCEAIGNPTPKIYWVRKDKNEDILEKGPQLTIDQVQPYNAGTYECIAEVTGFAPIRLAHHLKIKGPPLVLLSEDTIYRHDDIIEMRCEVRSTPLPSKITWTKNGKPLSDQLAKGRVRLQELQMDYGIESRVTIDGVDESDFGRYSCGAINEFGNHSMAVDVRYRNILEKLMQNVEGLSPKVIVGIILVLVLLLLFMFVFCCYSWRRARKGKSKGSGFSDHSSDIMVKCEEQYGLDGNMYSPSYHDSIVIGKDYVSVPQDNPNLDYLPAPVVYPHSSYTGSPHMMHQLGPHYDGDMHDRSYGSFTSGGSTPAVPDMYGGGMVNYPRPMGPHVGMLDPVAEVTTPETEGAGTPIIIHQGNYSPYVQERPVSRLSTHV